MDTIIVPTTPPVTADGLKAPFTTVTIAAGISVMFKKNQRYTEDQIDHRHNGTIIWLTVAIRFRPPMRIAATQAARIREEITTAQEYSPRNGIFTQFDLFGSKKF